MLPSLISETKYGLVASLSKQILRKAAGKAEEEAGHRLPVLVYVLTFGVCKLS
jgi:hypothetical protein